MGIIKPANERAYRKEIKALEKSAEVLVRAEGFPRSDMPTTAVNISVVGDHLTVNFLSDSADAVVGQRNELNEILRGSRISLEDAPDWECQSQHYSAKYLSAATVAVPIRENGGAEALKTKIDAFASQRAAEQRGETTGFRDRLAAEGKGAALER